jgi:LDH2 family malate/lactate/ureidoglycolate dehydrogenase
MVARAKHTTVPPGSLLDKDGNPTTDPEAYFNGGMLLPFGAHKGSALATLSVLLSHVLVPASDFPSEDILNATFILAIDAGIFHDRATVEAQTDSVITRIKAVAPAAGFDEVLVPGEPEVRAAAQRRIEGIPVAEDTWAEIIAAGASVGVTVKR